MLKKIISGGQTGADQAALDVAMKLGILHSGWIPKGRLTEAGILDDKYNLKEMETSSYNKRTEQNVIDSDGTLIISHGELTGGSHYTREMAILHKRPLLQIDLNETNAFQAATRIGEWLNKNEIEVLNVAGPRASKDPMIYQATADILETAFYLNLIDVGMQGPDIVPDAPHSQMEMQKLPQTVEQAAEKLLSKLSLRDKTMIANIPKDNLVDLYPSFETYIRNEVRLWLSGESLLKSCRKRSGKKDLDEHNAALIIINTLWDKLQKTNVLRIVK